MRMWEWPRISWTTASIFGGQMTGSDPLFGAMVLSTGRPECGEGGAMRTGQRPSLDLGIPICLASGGPLRQPHKTY